MASFQQLQQSEEPGRLADAAVVDAERLHLVQQVAYVDDLVADEGLQEDAHQAHEAVLKVLVLGVEIVVC